VFEMTHESGTGASSAIRWRSSPVITAMCSGTLTPAMLQAFKNVMAHSSYAAMTPTGRGRSLMAAISRR